MAGKLAGLRSVANEWSALEKESLTKSPRLIARSANMDATLLLKLKKKAAYRPIIIYTVSVAIL